MKEEEKIFKDWLKTRPQVVQDLATNYPPGNYIVKKGAPYGITCEGTKVTILSYFESGKLGVVVESKNKLPQALEHEKMLGLEYGKTQEWIEEMHKNDVKLMVEPIWLNLLQIEY